MSLPENVTIIKHPVAEHKMSQLRDIKTPSKRFRRVMRDISFLMAYEVTRGRKTKTVPIQTPMEKNKFSVLAEDLYVVSILRAGNGMLEGFLDLNPLCRVGHIGIYRDKFIGNTVEYYFKLPGGCKGKPIILLDPMLATGATALASIERLKEYGVGRITLACLLAAPEGVHLLNDHYPDVKVVTFSVDRALNDDGYILPGLGDAGDRLYGTT
ncbi:MAG: uracil phosphoribosyltransferase [bacterium]|nr:uracil phosphoribosyltransferase [bacterium]